MLNIGAEASSKAKCYFTHTLLPQYIDDKQPPTKRKPFSAIYGQAFNHSLDIIAPASSRTKLQEAITSAAGKLQYCKVHLKLLDVLTGVFFNQYIKTGNILLLSEPHNDTTFSLADGLLTISLDKATYERAGLQGKPVADNGRKHIKSRYEISLNLRLPSMVKGKKGFERVLWAAENVFTDAVTWLFYDLRNPMEQVLGPVEGFRPFLREVEGEVAEMEGLLVPAFPENYDGEGAGSKQLEIDATELLEWLGLVCLDSPRVRAGDGIDSFLSRYEVPRFGGPDEELKAVDVVKLRWHGFMPAVWVAKVFTAAIKATAGEKEWFAMQVCGFEAKNLMVLVRGGKAMTWECE